MTTSAPAAQKVEDQQRLLAQMASESMQQADPQLIGLWAMLKAQNPSDLTTQLKTVGNLMDREHTALDELKTARTLLAVKERDVEDAKQGSRPSARRPRRTWCSASGWRSRPPRPRTP